MNNINELTSRSLHYLRPMQACGLLIDVEAVAAQMSADNHLARLFVAGLAIGGHFERGDVSVGPAFSILRDAVGQSRVHFCDLARMDHFDCYLLPWIDRAENWHGEFPG